MVNLNGHEAETADTAKEHLKHTGDSSTRKADFQSGSYGYRPKRTAHEAVARVARAIVEEKTRIVDLDLATYFDNVQHSLLLEKVARRVQDDAVMHLLKMILKATGKKGVPQGGVITPLTQKVILTASSA